MERVKVCARELADALAAAHEAGVSPAILLPELVSVFRESGMMTPAALDGIPFPA